MGLLSSSSLLLAHLLLLAPHLSSGLPSHSCYWTESCQSKWFGGCGAGHTMIEQSDDCNGLCPEPNYHPCLPFHTHFHCCKPDIPRLSENCLECQNKMDFGDEYICCTDCSEPVIVDKNVKSGYCKTGADLAVQLKPLETFRWVAGPWMKCSSPCDGGIRYRDVGCFGSSEDTSIRHFPVSDVKCSSEQMPARQESCNMRSCGDYGDSNLKSSESNGMSDWLIALFVLIGVVAAGGLSFAGYTYYKRKTAAPSGFVYIMLEGYS